MEEKIEEILRNSYTKIGEFDESKATKELLNLFSVNGCFTVFIDVYKDEETFISIFEDGKAIYNNTDEFENSIKELKLKIEKLNNR